MKFMFTIYHDEKVLDAMPEKEMQALVDSAIEYAEEIRRSGHYIASDALQRTARPGPSASAPARPPPRSAPSSRRRSSWVDSSSSRPRTWTRRARSPRGSRRRASRCSRSGRSGADALA